MRCILLLLFLGYIWAQTVTCCIKSTAPFCVMVNNSTDCTNYLGYPNTGTIQSNPNCGTVTCPMPPTGPCCAPQTFPVPPLMCSQYGAYDCYANIVSVGGSYGGDNQNCSSSTCPAVIGSCTFENKTCVNNTYERDCQAFGGFINLGQTCAPPKPHSCSRCPPRIGSSLNQFTIFSASPNAALYFDTNILVDGKYGSLNNQTNNLLVVGGNQFNGDIAYNTATDPNKYFHFNDSLANAAASDLTNLYWQIKNCSCKYAIPNLVNGTTLRPGKHCRTNPLGDSLALVGDITFDAQGNSRNYFIIHSSRAITINAMTRFILKNGARKENVFVLSEDTMFMELAMEAFGTFISYSTSSVIAVYSEHIKYFSINGNLQFQVNTLLPFRQAPCAGEDGACLVGLNQCRRLNRDACAQFNGAFQGEDSRCAMSISNKNLGIAAIIVIGSIALLVFVFFAYRQSQNKQDDIMDR